MERAIHIPLEPYDLFVSKFQTGSREYAWLKNSVIVSRRDGSQYVQVLCDDERAEALKDAAAQLCPEILPHIQEIADPM